jgi:surfeit locus 1 family protein
VRRLPLVPTLLVGLAIAAMIALGIWQLRRAEWKEALLARYAAAEGSPPVAWPKVPPADGSLLFRRASGFCLEVTRWSARSGHNRAGQPGWRHIAACRTGAEGPGMQVDMGWSKNSAAPRGWRGGAVGGVIDSDRDHIIMLVSDVAAPGLEPSAKPSPADIPNNHRAYAVQWFLFAAVALAIYLLALRRRQNPLPTGGEGDWVATLRPPR